MRQLTLVLLIFLSAGAQAVSVQFNGFRNLNGFGTSIPPTDFFAIAELDFGVLPPTTDPNDFVRINGIRPPDPSFDFGAPTFTPDIFDIDPFTGKALVNIATAGFSFCAAPGPNDICGAPAWVLVIDSAVWGGGTEPLVMTVVPDVPIPATAWLFGSALLGLAVIKRRKA